MYLNGNSQLSAFPFGESVSFKIAAEILGVITPQDSFKNVSDCQRGILTPQRSQYSVPTTITDWRRSKGGEATLPVNIMNTLPQQCETVIELV